MSGDTNLEGGTTAAAISERFDWLNAFCREQYGAPDGWRWYAWTRTEYDKPHEFLLVKGAVCTAKITRGKRKGHDNWKLADPETQRVYSVSRKALTAFQHQWQERTGKCFECYGTGQEWGGWSALEGTRYRPCAKCDATGNSHAALSKPTTP